MLKRIFAVVEDKDFYAFQRHAKSEGLNMGQAFAALAYVYATGNDITIAQYKDYLYELYQKENVPEPNEFRNEVKSE